VSDDLRERIAETLYESLHRPSGGTDAAWCQDATDAVMAVVHPEIDRCDRVRALCDEADAELWPDAYNAALDDLRAALDGPGE